MNRESTCNGKLGVLPVVRINDYASRPANATGGKNEREFAAATPTNIGGKNWNFKLQQSLQQHTLPPPLQHPSLKNIRKCA